ncbi:unnamed protein product [Bursaphelenchus xylophilus]|uniref:(pine wood nematode) hypothetical protein n=1 Tax=Bursaphelenchus xylophilus TaxID=6326 RepID=A0A7I8XLQ7_BURXY|nr:unnamed protein product [Bursaphelenchus xylophilus]CAG9086256.1 unnamed protein product [Bursaphelenchus xylophilus]
MANESKDTKRVSFGSSNDVRLIVYDEPNCATYTFHKKKEHPRSETPDRVLVRSENCEEPRPISPPAHLFTPPDARTPERKMDSEVDNPFRPKDVLYNEVDPIVEAYKTKPFPPSPSGSPIPQDLTPFKNGRHVTLECGVVHSDSAHVSETHPLTHPDQKKGENGLSDLPPPNNVELVHLEKKKKCCCCSVQ